ncbi:MAG: hypothetical protein ABSF93_18160 [Candidatus Sulfotelmatobacter sp.]|jgi:hypothetical protein
MQRLVLSLAAALILLNVLVIPTAAKADGPQNPNCPPKQLCPP